MKKYTKITKTNKINKLAIGKKNTKHTKTETKRLNRNQKALGGNSAIACFSSYRAWNSLPQFVTDSPSPGNFRKYMYLKTYLFSLSF